MWKEISMYVSNQREKEQSKNRTFYMFQGHSNKWRKHKVLIAP